MPRKTTQCRNAIQELFDISEKRGEITPELAHHVLECAEKTLKTRGAKQLARKHWLTFLNHTGEPAFLQALGSPEARNRWADAAVEAVRAAEYTLFDMLQDRADRYPSRTYFQTYEGDTPAQWNFRTIRQRVQDIAAVLFKLNGELAAPRVGIFASNSLNTACTDLACLCYGIVNAPLATTMERDVIAWVIERLSISIIATDTADRARLLAEIRKDRKLSFTILLIQDDLPGELETVSLEKELSALTARESKKLTNGRPQLGLDDTCTVMFTSGSTGLPKGVAFSQFNLVTKRFCRAAALPKVGADETLLCYLPLFHTFGRYLEMLGMLYWSGRYVFVGNPTAETFLKRLPEVRPTGLISIPLRWIQIQDKCLEMAGETAGAEEVAKAFHEVTGGKLHWGLSAAGYLSPKVFHFYRRHDVELCSGFGMTEATGGITMTPPGEYVDNSVGVPLPGIEARLSKEGELQLAGPYIARYLKEKPTKKEDLPAIDPNDTFWLKTGDLFRELDNGHYEIVDRIKDIYKNNRGQTVSPQKVEKKFRGVPGIKSTFLVGDGRAYNVLLIVPEEPDEADDVEFPSGEARDDYYHQIIATANRSLPPYERVVNFSVLERDFSADKGELTPKGTFRRKIITKNFDPVIKELYKKNYIQLDVGEIKVRIPRWFYRDLGLLETDLEVNSTGLHDTARDIHLKIQPLSEAGWYLIGDMEYCVDFSKQEYIDLGALARQPQAWVGNRELIAFCPCKEGWDVRLKNISDQQFLDKTFSDRRGNPEVIQPREQADQRLFQVNRLVTRALYGTPDTALQAVDKLGAQISRTDDRLAQVIRRRLESLARHPDEEVRCLAYRVLLLDDPMPDYGRTMPTFLFSGLTFLNAASIQAIAQTNLRQRRLGALRQRMEHYRASLSWPADHTIRRQFERLFDLLAEFVRFHPEYYATVRAELVSWILHDQDPDLAKAARQRFDDTSAWFENWLAADSKNLNPAFWRGRIVFDEGITETEIEWIKRVLVGTTFLKESVLLIYDDEDFGLAQVKPGGIWISRISTRHDYKRFRMAVNTEHGQHYDLQLILREDLGEGQVKESILWLIATTGYPLGSPALSRFGCCRPELRALSLAHRNSLSVWDRIRQFASEQGPGTPQPDSTELRKNYIRALSMAFIGWWNSGRRIVPGSINPTNILVPSVDFREVASIATITGWQPYRNTLSLVRPMLKNFYRKVVAYYPLTDHLLEYRWIFEACHEALGRKEAERFLKALIEDLAFEEIPIDVDAFVTELEAYLADQQKRYQVPLALQNAIDRYREWVNANPDVTTSATVELIRQLYRLYRLDRYPEIARYTLYRQTCFADAELPVQERFDKLLDVMFHRPDVPATRLVELSELQAEIQQPEDRMVFSALVFPKAQQPDKMEVTATTAQERKHVMVRTRIADRYEESYTIREPLSAEEVGKLYRLFFQQHFPKTVSEMDQHIVTTDSLDRIIGGICFKRVDEEVVHLDGLVVAPHLKRRGIGGAMLEDFCVRLAAQGVKVIKTHFFMRKFCSKHGFKVDRRWGGLVRFLDVRADPDVPVAPVTVPVETQ